MTDGFPVTELRSLLEQARAAEPERKQFGAGSHRYELAPPASLEEVEAFEQEIGVTLPEDYRNFLLHMGNGGAGPFYGLFSLEQVRGWLHWPLEPEKDPVLRPGRENAENCGEENWKRGCLIIESQGDTYFTCLLVTGPDRGRVFYIDYEGSWIFFPREPDFLTWYTRWLRDTAKGYRRQGWFATNLDGDEADLRKHYTEAESMKERRLALVSMEKFPEFSPETCDFIRKTLTDLAREPEADGLSELAYRVDPAFYEWFLEQRWEAGLYDQVLYDVCHTPGDEKALAERWRERILAKLEEVPPDDCGLAVLLLQRSGGVEFAKAAAQLKRVPRHQMENYLIRLGRLPDAGEHLDFWLPMLEEREDLQHLKAALWSVPQVNDTRLRDALLAIQAAYPYALELLHTDWNDPESMEQSYRRIREREIWTAADGILKKFFYEDINPVHSGIPRPWRLELHGYALADLDMHRKPPEGIPLHPLIALSILKKEDRLPATAWDWDRKLKKIKKLELLLRDYTVKTWNNQDRTAWLHEPEEHAPPKPYYYDLRDWSAIGRMTSLRELRIAEICVEDFSFLSKCKELRTLSLYNTNFTDCRLLLDLPELKSVDLRQCRLTHTEVLDGLSLEECDL